MKNIFWTIVLLTVACQSWSAVKVEKITYGEYGQCYSLSNDTVRVVVTADVGPRVICYQMLGGQNVFSEMDPSVSTRNDKDWHIYGGHRFSHAPEMLPRTYTPDNTPVKVEIVGIDAVKFTPDLEKQNGIQRELLVRLDESGTGVEVTHTLTNMGRWEIELAPWALTVVKPGGEAWIPNEPFVSQGDNLLPTRNMAIWGYTDLGDSRWTFGTKYIRLKCDAKRPTAQKIGIENKQGWVGYLNDGILFINRFGYRPDKTYTDRSSNCEFYTAGNFMEIESLGYLQKLDVGKSATHVERWYLFTNVKALKSDNDLEKVMIPLLEKTKAVEF